MIDSQYSRLDLRQDGAPDRHVDHLMIDGEALYLLDTDGYKGAYCPIVSATAEQTKFGTWGRRMQSSIPCPAGEWLWETHWTPSNRRGPGGTRSERPRDQRVISSLASVPRGCPEFAKFGRRNTAEGRNYLAKKAFPTYGRDSHLAPGLQILDHHGAAEVINAITWSRHPSARDPWS